MTGTLNTLPIDWYAGWNGAVTMASGYSTLLLILAAIAFFPVVVGIALWLIGRARRFAPKV